MQLPGRHVGDVHQRDAHGGGDLRGHLVHGVGADDQKIRPAPLQGLCGIGQDTGAPVPVPGLLAAFDLVKVHAVEQAAGRMQTAQGLGRHHVDDLIIGQRAFPAHAAQKTDGFHVFSL